LGLEPTPEMYLDHLVEICREIRKKLRPDGVFFLNIGDCYIAGGSVGRQDKSKYGGKEGLHCLRAGIQSYGEWTGPKARAGDGEFKKRGMSRVSIKHPILKQKDLCLIPFRLAVALQSDGWWVRSVIIWSKPNPMPESVRDRPSESHEYILMLTKSARYYFDQEAVREPYQPDSLRPTKVNVNNPKGMNRQGIDTWLERIPKVRGYKTKRAGRGSNNPELGNRNFMPIQGEQFHGQDISSYPSGRNIRSVWEFATQPYSKAHFAVFPEKLPEICIKAATPEVGCCSKCGAPWERIVIIPYDKDHPTFNEWRKQSGINIAAAGKIKFDPRQTETSPQGYGGEISRYYQEVWGQISSPKQTQGWQPSCSCKDATKVSSLVLDPFAGSGTTGWVAKRLNRRCVMYELSKEYCELALERNRQQVIGL